MFNRIWEISRNIGQKGKGVILFYGWGNCLKKKTDTYVEEYTDIPQSKSATAEESHDWGVFETYLRISKLADELWGKPTTESPSASTDSQFRGCSDELLPK